MINVRGSLGEYPVERALLVRLPRRRGGARGRSERLLLRLRHLEQVRPLVYNVLLECKLVCMTQLRLIPQYHQGCSNNAAKNPNSFDITRLAGLRLA